MHATDLILTLRWPMAMVIVAFLGYLAAQRACTTVEEAQRAPERTVEQTAEALGGIAERFRTGKITTTFLADLPRLIPEGAPRLELVTFEATETFTRSDERRVMFDLIDLGTTVTEIRVPVTYRYHVELDDQWRIDVRDHSCVVYAPPLRATQPPAIHTDRLEKHSTRGWLREDPTQQMDALVRSMTPTLEQRAEAPETIQLVREEARQQLAAFIRTWLLHEDHWRQDRFRTITVIFTDEEGRTIEITPPTVVYEGEADGATYHEERGREN
jgi:hypothetical protein